MKTHASMRALGVRAPTAATALLIAIALSVRRIERLPAQCTPPCSTSPAVPTSRVEIPITDIGAWGSVALCECNNFVLGWHRWVEEDHQVCGNPAGQRGEAVAKGFQPDGSVAWSTSLLSFEPTNNCNILHADVSVAVSKSGDIWTSWMAQPGGAPPPSPGGDPSDPFDPRDICSPIMLQTGFTFSGAPNNIVQKVYPLNPCIADNEYWPSSGRLNAAAVVGWTKTNDLNRGPKGLIQQIDEGTITQIRDCNIPNYWENQCGVRVSQWQPCVGCGSPTKPIPGRCSRLELIRRAANASGVRRKPIRHARRTDSVQGRSDPPHDVNWSAGRDELIRRHGANRAGDLIGRTRECAA